MITGGTDSIGVTVFNHLLETDIGQIRISAVIDMKQDDIRHEPQT